MMESCINKKLPRVSLPTGITSLIFNTDGVPVFRSSSFLFWQLYLLINELPYRMRYSVLLKVHLCSTCAGCILSACHKSIVLMVLQCHHIIAQPA